jgi:3-hydroxyisobutyrate dehydrogenase
VRAAWAWPAGGRVPPGCNRLIAEQTRSSSLASPLLDVCHALYGETAALGHGNADMAAVLYAIGARTDGGQAAH